MEVICIGGGISGMATAFAIEQQAALRGRNVTVRVVEAEPRLGGKVDSRRVDGFLVEGGVNGWLDSKPTTDKLCADLGIFEQRLPSNDAARRRYVFRHGRLHPLPESPAKFLGSGLMSLSGKLRILGELWAKPPPMEGDETLADFARRRLGPEALQALLDPMVSGIFAGDPERMSLKSCFPRIAEVESQYGGLIRGMVKLQKAKAKARRAGGEVSKGSAAGPGGRLMSFAGGTSELIEALRRALRTPPEVGQPVTKVVQRRGGGYAVHMAQGRVLTADRVVAAAPAWAMARCVSDLDAGLSAELAGIPYAAVAVVALGWNASDLPRALDGFGFLVPDAEGRKLLGSLWDSSVFANRAPDGLVLTRSMVGGMRHGDLAMQPEDVLRQSVHSELAAILGAEAPPVLAHVVRHERAIPQYLPGHGARLERIDARLSELAGFYITGNAYRGVGLNDCTAQAGHVASRLLDDIEAKAA